MDQVAQPRVIKLKTYQVVGGALLLGILVVILGFGPFVPSFLALKQELAGIKADLHQAAIDLQQIVEALK